MNFEIYFVSKFQLLEDERHQLTGQYFCNIIYTCANRTQITNVCDGNKVMDYFGCNIMTTKCSSNDDVEDNQSLRKKAKKNPSLLVIDGSVL